jgi:ATP-dependent Clp protease ATP-binding subunit ClpC
MADRFDKFTPGAQRTITIAGEEARRFNHSAIGTEHILLALTSQGDEVAARVLANLNVEPVKVRAAIEFIIGIGDRPFEGNLDLTPRVKRVIELTVDESRRMGHTYIGTEHLLMGLSREGEGIAAGVLESLGISLDALRAETKRVLEGPQAGGLATAGVGASGQMYPQKQLTSGSKSKTPSVEAYGISLTQAAIDGRLDPVIGRESEIERVIQILSRRTKNNPVLLGEPGVGKTAIAEGLAQRLLAGDVPESIAGKRVLTLDMGLLVAGTKFRGEFEERVKKVVEELRKADDIILFIDEMHTMVGAGAAEGAVDASNMFKPPLARGELQCIGATTRDEYRKYVERDAALERRFQPVYVDEPTRDQSVAILHGLRSRYEDHHKVKISDEAINAAVDLAIRYIADRHLPDKAIDLIDEASSRVQLRISSPSPEVRQARKTVDTLAHAKERAIADGQVTEAARIRTQEGEAIDALAVVRALWEEARQIDRDVVTFDDIADVVAAWTGVPVSRLTAGESERLMKMEAGLHERLIGQDEAIVTVARAVRRARAGLKDPKRPIGSFLFLGPTGVGKTELAKALAEFMFGSEDNLIRLDMSEYMEKHDVSRLVGAPPGYIGYEDGGQLTELVRRKNYAVILLDEIEKAHPEALNILLSVLEDGHLTDAKGRRVDFRNCVIIMTSNLGARAILNSTAGAIGFRATALDASSAAERNHTMMTTHLDEALKAAFKPEFLNRIDARVVFHPLTREELREIVRLMLARVALQLTVRGLGMVVTEQATDRLIELGYDINYGARPMRRVVTSMIEDELAEAILANRFSVGDVIEIDYEHGAETFTLRTADSSKDGADLAVLAVAA